MYDKKLIKKLVKKYERKAGISLMLYQETGNEKHERISEEAEVIAAALRVMLVDAERDEEHQQTAVNLGYCEDFHCENAETGEDEKDRS